MVTESTHMGHASRGRSSHRFLVVGKSGWCPRRSTNLTEPMASRTSDRSPVTSIVGPMRRDIAPTLPDAGRRRSFAVEFHPSGEGSQVDDEGEPRLERGHHPRVGGDQRAALPLRQGNVEAVVEADSFLPRDGQCALGQWQRREEPRAICHDFTPELGGVGDQSAPLRPRQRMGGFEGKTSGAINSWIWARQSSRSRRALGESTSLSTHLRATLTSRTYLIPRRGFPGPDRRRCPSGPASSASPAARHRTAP